MEEKRQAVVMLQLGGPDSLEAVEPFLYNLFCDPDIIDLPLAFLFRKPLARLISSRRAPIAQKLYQGIGGRSPIREQTQMQADALKAWLKAEGHAMPVEVAMRYWHPRAEETVHRLREQGITDVILLPLYPHYSKATTGSSVREWNEVVSRLGAHEMRSTLVEAYYDDPLYIRALVERVREAIDRVPESDRSKIHLLFSAHGTPLKLVREGDPYSLQIRRTYERVVEEGAFGLPHSLCFQSKVGPQQWLKPSLVDTVKRLAEEKVSHVIVNPIAFVTDHIETLSEISIEAKHEAETLGIRYFAMTAPLLVSAPFIECLGRNVIAALAAPERTVRS
ncbi:MAG: ferrochelatase [Acidobacteriota bacterium]